MLRCWSEPRAICFALLGNLVPRIVFRIHVFKTERSDRAHLRHVFTGLRPVEVRRIAGQNNNAAGWISLHGIAVELLAQADIEHTDMTV
jgi:hypothetical protein